MSAAAFYTGHVSHRRISSPGHRLRYKLAYVLLDLDQLGQADSLSRYLGVERPGLMSVQSKDHGDGCVDLAGFVRSLLKQYKIRHEAFRIELLTLPRMFGFVFNPISVYFIYDALGELHHVIYEVNNTFGERQFYVCPTAADKNGYRHSSEKTMYVSPFMDETGSYDFYLHPPGDKTALTIHYKDIDGAEALRAHLALKRLPISNRSAFNILVNFPLMTLGVVAGIHWHAIKLLVKGARYRFHKKRSPIASSMGYVRSNPLQKNCKKVA